MKLWLLSLCLLFPVISFAAEDDTPAEAEAEPNLHDHYIALKRMQERLAGRSLEEQAKLQPQIERAQRKACAQLQKDRRERVPRDEYRRQGVFSLELEQWCQTGR
jgi:hypothetical protein